MNFKNCVPSIFAPAEERDRRDLQKIEQRAQQRNYEKNIAMRLAALTDAVGKSKQDCEVTCHNIDKACQVDLAAVAHSLNHGYSTISSVAINVAGATALRGICEELKKELRRLMVGPSEKALSDFKKEHKKIISKLPPLKKAPTPHFVPTPLPVDHFVKRLPSVETQVMTGIFVKPKA